jgi:hypothetical protein
MSMNFRDIEDVILDVKKEINKFQIQELDERRKTD